MVAGEPGGQLGDAAHAHGVVVAAGEQAGPGGRADGGGVEVGEAQTAGGQAVEGGRLDVGAEAPQLGEAHVVEHDEHDVGGPARSPSLGRPPRLRVEVVPAYDPAERTVPVVHGRERTASGRQEQAVPPASPQRTLAAQARVSRSVASAGSSQPAVTLALVAAFICDQ